MEQAYPDSINAPRAEATDLSEPSTAEAADIPEPP